MSVQCQRGRIGQIELQATGWLHSGHQERLSDKGCRWMSQLSAPTSRYPISLSISYLVRWGTFSWGRQCAGLDLYEVHEVNNRLNLCLKFCYFIFGSSGSKRLPNFKNLKNLLNFLIQPQLLLPEKSSFISQRMVPLLSVHLLLDT